MPKQSTAKRRPDPLIERWTNVERVLDAMPEHERTHHWNMATWGEKTTCGTVACAAGTCGLDPWFRDRGFKLDFDARGEAEISNVESFFGIEGSKRIFFNSKQRSVETVLGEVREYLGELQKVEALTEGLDVPEIGAEWPEQGGIYAGALLGAKGAPDYLLIVGPEYDGSLNWKDAKAWAAKVEIGAHRDFTLPDRRDSMALFDRVRSLFSQSWYWTSEQHAGDSGNAWCQLFSDGDQTFAGKGYDCRARAVRKCPIQSFGNSIISGAGEKAVA